MSVKSDEIVLRGDEAARAQRIDLVAPSVSTGMAQPSLIPTGPWAADVHDAFAEARDEGFAVGHQEGWEVGLTQGLAEAREQTAQLAAMVESMVRQSEAHLAQLTARVAGETTDLALAMAELILAREVVCAADPGAEAIARCLDMVPLAGAVVAHLHPDDLSRLGPLPGLANREVKLVPDTKLARGDTVVMIDETMIDGRLGQALERVAEVLA